MLVVPFFVFILLLGGCISVPEDSKGSVGGSFNIGGLGSIGGEGTSFDDLREAIGGSSGGNFDGSLEHFGSSSGSGSSSSESSESSGGTSSEGASADITSVSQGIFVITKKNLEELTKGVTTLQTCLLDFGQITSDTLSNTIQDIIKTGLVGPKNIFKLFIFLVPGPLGGNILRYRAKKIASCVNSADNGPLIKETIQDTLSCVGESLVNHPLDSINNLIFDKLNEEFATLPMKFRHISKSTNLVDMGRRSFGFVTDELGFGIKLGMNAVKLGVTMIISGPKTLTCIATHVAAEKIEQVVTEVVKITACSILS